MHADPVADEAVDSGGTHPWVSLDDGAAVGTLQEPSPSVPTLSRRPSRRPNPRDGVIPGFTDPTVITDFINRS